MSTTSTPVSPVQESSVARLRNFGLGALFALVLLIPKLLNIRRDRHSWLAFRIVLALGGASLVILPLSLWNSWTAAIAGLAMFLAAILLPAAKPDTIVADTAAQLGALVIVNGGAYQRKTPSPDDSLTRGAQSMPWLAPDAAETVQLFVCPDRIWALDAQLHPLLVIPISQITSATAAVSGDNWILRVRWEDHSADFQYRGIFAEHLARVAESTLRGVIHPILPVLPQKRAATA